nr:gas vesicle protein GvpD [Candidatus Freyarchaeota archaeon]
MSIALNVPQEIVEALEARTFSLHIKGSAGTGKTTLALELMRLFPEEAEAIYLSTRVSPERLYEQFPWVESCIHQENILDAKNTWSPRTKEETMFEYVDKPTFLRSLYSRAVEAEGKHLTIVVDSLEALKSNLKIPRDDTSVERDVLEIADRLNANVIFVSESPHESQLDYLVDGVVKLERVLFKERLIRKIYIEKVRGAKIENPVYLFTLKDGRFTCFKTGFSLNLVHKDFRIVERETGGKIPTQISELDKILGGGFEKGSFNIIEIGKDVGMAHAYILSPLFLNFILQDIPVLSIPSKSLFSYDIIDRKSSSPLNEILISSLSSGALEKLKKCFHVFLPSPRNISTEIETYSTYSLNGKDCEEDLAQFIKIAKRVLNENQLNTVVVSIATDTFEYVYGQKNFLKMLQNWFDQIKQLNGVMVLLLFEHASSKVPTNLATSHLRFENISGNILFYGEIPKTKMYVTALDVFKQNFQLRLTPIE